MSSFSLRPLLVLLFVVITSGCSTTSSVEEDTGDPRDPFESINRPLWTFTYDYVDKYVARPASLAYGEYTPVFLREGLYNMAQHFNEPSTLINQLLLFQFENAAKTSGRFVMNSTIGLLGFYDPAKDFGWTRNQKEFGEVMGYYGVPDGPYIIIPGIKPSSIREEVGDYVDQYYWPYATLGFWPAAFRWAIDGMENRITLVEQEDIIEESIDSYEFVKNAYFQNMRFKVYDGNPPIEVNEDDEEALDDFLDELDDFEDMDDTQAPETPPADDKSESKKSETDADPKNGQKRERQRSTEQLTKRSKKHKKS